MKKGKILVVDDNAGIRSALKIMLPAHFEEVECIASPKVLISTMESMKPHVILLDMNFNTNINSGNEGLFWTSEIKKMSPKTEVVLFTAYADIQLAVEGMKRGAFDFVVKPWDNDRFIETLTKARDNALADLDEPVYLSSGSKDSDMYWGKTPQMEVIARQVSRIAPTDATVLITGENGTGKDLLATEIHKQSLRCNMSMVAVDLGAITETLFESELFGHVKGAFTDAHTDKIGKFEQANNSTLFLDEIGNIPLHLQAKLLRALQNRVITKVGDGKEIPFDIRLICATNMNLEKLVSEGKFREDLYYRINTMHISLPPLRERKEDIVPIAGRFIENFNQKYHRNIKGISPEGVNVLYAHPWNGNIRELQNVIEKAVILSETEYLKASDFMLNTHQTPKSEVVEQPAKEETLEEVEERTIRNAMSLCSGNLSKVAKQLNISRPTLYAKLKKYNI
ncbi:MAG: sigma-54-dependent Fis family transcriptional regulator [Bacteroidales bacterium]|nr:sigma-54-dependent Fis family transcriptional regulator [Bacteroidales bacterium]